MINNYANNTNSNNVNRGTAGSGNGTDKNIIPVANTGNDEAPTYRLMGSILVVLGSIIATVYKKKTYKEFYK